MKNAWLFYLLTVVGFPAIFANTFAKSKKPYKIVCYLGSWANYRNGDGKFLIEDIDPQLCTHLIYGFAKLSHDNKIAAYDPYLDLKENWGLGAYERFTGLKKKNPNLKTLLAIGGWNEGSSKYSRMAKNPSSRKTFINSCVTYLQRYGFDGLDLDWEYPATRGGIPEDKKNFISLLKLRLRAKTALCFWLHATTASLTVRCPQRYFPFFFFIETRGESETYKKDGTDKDYTTNT
ncbi:probable chitinase 2 [Trichonephila clavipes]|nr:probable chitinase 2 [Trichonephila clavipes]